MAKGRKKPFISISEIQPNKLYVDKEGCLYRRYQNRIESMKTGSWKEVKINYDALTNTKVREY